MSGKIRGSYATTSGTITSGSSPTNNVQISLGGRAGCSATIAGTWTASLIGEVSGDGGATWDQVDLFLRSVGTPQIAIGANGVYTLTWCGGGITHARIRALTYTSGTATITLTASMFPMEVADKFTQGEGGAIPLNAVQIAGEGPGAATRFITTDADGDLQIDVISIIPGSAATSLGKAEDAAHVSGDVGVEMLAVRTDTPANRSGADGDYEPLQISAGRVWASATIDAALPAGSNAIGTVTAVGAVAHGAADSGNPVKIGGRADTTFQAAEADGDRVDALFDVYGHLRVRTDHANNWSYHENSSSALTDASVQGAPGAGLSVYIGTIVISTGAATAFNAFIEEGASTILGPYYLEATAGRGAIIKFSPPKKATANTAVTISCGAVLHSLDLTGFIAP